MRTHESAERESNPSRGEPYQYLPAPRRQVVLPFTSTKSWSHC